MCLNNQSLEYYHLCIESVTSLQGSCVLEFLTTALCLLLSPLECPTL
uniref:Uncharacterized protein n=1 Tax=Arundo donax TaxID=35708 RepID=A0A0A8ZVF0_ARUDO